MDCLIARTGYTGEDGFEIYFAPEHSEKLWNDLLHAGESAKMIPCGLGARNTLRLEAGMCLYGHEIDDTTTPWEAGLGWICKMEKAPFLGSEVLAQQKQTGLPRKLVGFEMLDKRIGRDGYPVLIAGREAGRVTSGCPAPFLKKNIGMAYVPPQSSAVGTDIEISIRGQAAAARIVPIALLQATASEREDCGMACTETKTQQAAGTSANWTPSTDVSNGLRYTKQHEWVKVQGDTATIGITDYAQQRTRRRRVRRDAQSRRATQSRLSPSARSNR